MRNLLLICLLGLATLAVAQSDETRENGFIISTIEDQLSNETRVIRLTGVEGALSSDATVARITVADAEGIWLEIEDAQITWNRGALLRGRVEIERLAAARIALPRLPQGEPSAELPSAQAEPFSLPDLPVSLRLDALETPLIELGAPVIGLAAELSATGKIALADGRLDAEFAMDRLDGPGGALRLTAGFSNTATGLELDLSLSEPENGVVANLLQIEGRPPLDLTLQGGGPLEALDLALDLKAQGDDLVDGRLVVAGSGGSYRFDADVAGRLAPLVPPLYAGFFEGESALRVEGSSGPDGLDLSTLSIEAATLSLQGRLRTGADGFPTDLSLTGRLGAGDGQPVLLPVAGGETRVTRGDLALTLGDRERWELDLTLEGLETADLDIERVELRGSGEASDLEQAESRALGLSLTGRMSGFETADRGVRTALGEAIDLTVDGGWQAGQPFVLDRIDLRNETAELTGSGEVFEAVFTGEVAAKIGALDALAPLAGRPLSGAADVTLQGRLAPLESGFDLTLAGGLVDVTTGTAQLDALLRGATEVSGRLARGQEGTILDRFRIEGPLLDVTADGRLTNAQSDVVFEAALSDLAQIDPRTSGSATLVARAQGPTGSVEVETTLTLPQGRVLERPVEDLELSLTGLLRSTTRLTAQVAGSGQLDGSPLRLSADLEMAGAALAARDLDLDLAGTQAQGSVVRGLDGLIAGDLSLSSTDFAPLLALGLIEAEGAGNATLRLRRKDGAQSATLIGALEQVSGFGQTLTSLDLNAQVEDAFGRALVDGTARLRDAQLGGIQVTQADLSARTLGADMDVAFDAALAIGTQAQARALVSQGPEETRVTVQDLILTQGARQALLTAPTEIVLQPGRTAFGPLSLTVDGGRLEAEGVVGETLDLRAQLSALPLSIANVIQPALGLGGVLDGTLSASGPLDAPRAEFDLSAEDVVTALAQSYDLPPIDATVAGVVDGVKADVSAALSAGPGAEARLSGAIPLAPETEGLDLSVVLDRLPMALANRILGNPGLVGTLTGSAQVRGAIVDPRAAFDLAVREVSLDVLRQNGVAPLSASARGGYARDVLRVDRVEARNSQGLEATGSGTVPLVGSGLSLRLNGQAALQLANLALADRATQLSGRARANLAVTGRLSDPQPSGEITVTGATVVDPGTNLRLEQVGLVARIEGDRVILTNGRANLIQGGRASLEGEISLDAARNFPLDLALGLRRARYSDGDSLSTILGGEITLSGAALGDLLVGGEIELEQTEIVVPDGFGLAAGEVLSVSHRNAPQGVTMTLDRAGLRDPKPAAPAQRIGINLRLTAPNRMFVRGRGLDTELGGTLVLTGSLDDLVPVGGFEMRRGRFNVIGQRISFSEGAVTLRGTLDPTLSFVARTETDDAVVTVTVSGRASNPQITFTSAPELPQDEILARLIFNRSVEELSAFQLAQLAGSIATLTGAGGPGLVEALRTNIGLDNLEFVSGDDGQVGVRAGKYIASNVYVDVESDSAGDTRTSINLDLTNSLTARGTVGTDGETRLGIFFERDY